MPGLKVRLGAAFVLMIVTLSQHTVETVACADEALYRAKEAGRNRVVLQPLVVAARPDSGVVSAPRPALPSGA